MLAGEDPPRSGRRRSPIGDVVRGALGEVERYSRVRLQPIDDDDGRRQGRRRRQSRRRRARRERAVVLAARLGRERLRTPRRRRLRDHDRRLRHRDVRGGHRARERAALVREGRSRSRRRGTSVTTSSRSSRCAHQIQVDARTVDVGGVTAAIVLPFTLLDDGMGGPINEMPEVDAFSFGDIALRPRRGRAGRRATPTGDVGGDAQPVVPAARGRRRHRRARLHGRGQLHVRARTTSDEPRAKPRTSPTCRDDVEDAQDDPRARADVERGTDAGRDRRRGCRRRSTWVRRRCRSRPRLPPSSVPRAPVGDAAAPTIPVIAPVPAPFDVAEPAAFVEPDDVAGAASRSGAGRRSRRRAEVERSSRRRRRRRRRGDRGRRAAGRPAVDKGAFAAMLHATRRPRRSRRRRRNRNRSSSRTDRNRNRCRRSCRTSPNGARRSRPPKGSFVAAPIQDDLLPQLPRRGRRGRGAETGARGAGAGVAHRRRADQRGARTRAPVALVAEAEMVAAVPGRAAAAAPRARRRIGGTAAEARAGTDAGRRRSGTTELRIVRCVPSSD